MPIVFTVVADPVGAGFVESLSRPGGNVTGFTNFGNWHEREMARTAQGDRARRVASGVCAIPDPTGLGQMRRIQGVSAVASGWNAVRSACETPAEIEPAVDEIRAGAEWRPDCHGAHDSLYGAHRDLIIALAARHQLPAVYPFGYFVTGGGLISYGPDLPTSIGVRPATSIVSSRAKSRPNCRCRRRPSTSW